MNTQRRGPVRSIYPSGGSMNALSGPAQGRRLRSNRQRTPAGWLLHYSRKTPLIYSNVSSASFPVDRGQVAQLVEHRTENAGVAGSIPALATTLRSPATRASYGWRASLHAKGVHRSCEAAKARLGEPATKVRSFRVFRILPLLLIILVAGCKKDAATGASGSTQPPAAEAGARATAEPVKPLPEKLPDVVARVNGETVTRTELEEYVRNLEGQAGSAIPADQRDRIYRGVIDQLVGYKLLVQEAKARKVVVADADVDARIAEVKKQFPSEDLFIQTLIDRKMTLDQIKADARRDMSIARLIEAEIAPRVAVKPGQVEEFYKSNPEQFAQPEQVRASHILIRTEENADAATKAQAKAKAQQILKDVKAGKDFAALARQHSQDGSAVNGGDLGFFPQGQMVGPFNDAAFSLKPGATSDLVETQFGYHIIRVAEKQPARTVPLEEVRPRIEEFLQHQNRESETESFVKALRAKSKVEILV